MKHQAAARKTGPPVRRLAVLRNGSYASALALAGLALVPQPALGAEGDLFDINAGLMVWVLLVFGILLLILRRYAWGPILAAVNAREERIRSALDGADQSRDEAATLLAEQREHLAEARRRSGEIVAEGREAAEKVRAQIEAKARAEAGALVERARAEIARERDAAIEEIRRESVDIALKAASHLVSQRLDGESDREVVERYLSGIGSAS
ncbi:MAG: F0F1 ATP synthase subunit B [Gemmatimonadetes bacterium]|nr:F0F1 ATP synthase subunit B [Gemmatimonadota bacterium]